MRYRLDLVLRPAEGALLRTLGMTERRGFSTQSISGGRADADGRWRVSLVVDGDRAADTLRRQLQKNYDCLEVEIAPCP